MAQLNHPPEDRSIKIPHLVFGLLFLGIAAAWALVVSDVASTGELGVLGPVVLIAAGVVGLVASLAGSRRRQQAQRDASPFDHDDLTEEIR